MTVGHYRHWKEQQLSSPRYQVGRYLGRVKPDYWAQLNQGPRSRQLDVPIIYYSAETVPSRGHMAGTYRCQPFLIYLQVHLLGRTTLKTLAYQSNLRHHWHFFGIFCTVVPHFLVGSNKSETARLSSKANIQPLLILQLKARGHVKVTTSLGLP